MGKDVRVKGLHTKNGCKIKVMYDILWLKNICEIAANAGGIIF